MVKLARNTMAGGPTVQSTSEVILNKGGKYLSLCFNDQNPDFGKPGEKIRIVPPGARMPSGSKLYFSSMDELKELFKPHFRIIESKLITLPIAKMHIRNYFLMEKG